MPTPNHWSRGAVCCLLALAACSPAPETFERVSVDAFIASPEEVPVGGEVTLSWAVSGDVESVLVRQAATELISSTEKSGSVIASNLPAGRVPFSLVVVGRGGDDATASLEVTTSGAVEVLAFEVDRPIVASGGAAWLSWSTRGATNVAITAAGETLFEATGDEARSGSLLVRPEATTQYSLTASAVGSEDTSRLVVAVLPLPTLELGVTPARVPPGGQVQVVWSTVNASSLVLRLDDRPVFHASEQSVADGAASVTVDRSGLLTATATGPGGPTTQSVEVEVIPPARVNRFVALPSTVVIGSDFTLEWSLSGVDSVTLTGNGVPIDLAGHDAPTGSVILSPTETTLFVVSGEGEGGTTFAELLVSVYGTPVIDSFVSDRAEVFRNRQPAMLSWTTTGGTVVSIADVDGNLVELGDAPVAAASVPVSPADSTSYVMTLVGPGGIVHSAPVAITVSEPPPLVELSLDALEVLDGESTVLTWTVSDFDGFSLTANGVPVDLAGKSGEDSLVVTPTETTQYVMNATGAGGETSQSITLRVVKPPRFVSFTSPRQAEDGEVKVTRGRPYVVEWETTDATGVSFVPPSELTSDASEFVTIRGMEGTVTLATPGSVNPGSVNVTFPDGFRFPFFGASFDAVRMVVDGYICFGGDAQCGSYTSSWNSGLPSTSTPNNFIAPFWDDLQWRDSSELLMRADGRAPNRRVTLEWHRLDPYYNITGGTLTFQVVLYEIGDWEIRHAPRPLQNTDSKNRLLWGGSATIGVEGPNGESALEFAYNRQGALCSNVDPDAPGTVESCTALTRVAPAKLPPSGAAELVGDEDDILGMMAYGPLGAAESPQLVVKVFEPAVAHELSASRAHVGAGESVQLTWSGGPDASVVEAISIDDGTQALSGIDALSGTVIVNPTTTTTYTLSVANEAGDAATLEQTIEVAAPTVTFEVGKPLGPVGDPFEFHWTTSGATTLVVEGPDGQNILPAVLDIAHPGDRAALAESTVARSLSLSGTYTLKATNASGTTEASVEVVLVDDLEIVFFEAARERQTQGELVSLSWETFNAARVVVESDAPDTTPFDSDLPAIVRRSSTRLPMGDDDTTFTLTAYDAQGTTLVQASVTVAAVPKAVVSFGASPSALVWNETTTLTWSTEAATSVTVHELGSDGTPGAEVLEARDRFSGTLTRRLARSTTWRLVALNEIGTPTQADVSVNVTVQAPGVTLTVTPSSQVPRGGYVQLGWTADQAESLFLWKPDPEDPAEVVQTPYDVARFGFVDISATGTELSFVDSDDAPDFDNGASAPVTFPDGFSFPLFGQSTGAMIVHANGFLQLAREADGPFECAGPNTCASNTSSTTDAIKGVVAPFWDDLSACAGASDEAGCSEAEVRTRPPGRAYWHLSGVAPSRTLTVQWSDWDFKAAGSGPASLTFQARLQENGDIEFQYKKLDSLADAAAAAGDDAHALVEGLDSEKLFVLNDARALLSSGDGYRMYLGARPASGTLRSFFNPSSDTVTFRAVAENVEGTATASQQLSLLAGAGDLLIGELMIDPIAAGDDTGKEWLELRNTTDEPVNLRGYSLQTSSGSYSFTSDAFVPARANGEDGLLVLGQSAVEADNGGVPVAHAYGVGLSLDDLRDVVVLRYADVLIDRVDYDTLSGWTVPRGASLALDRGIRSGSANDSSFAWCRGVSSSGSSSPGAPNGACWRFEPVAYDDTTRLESRQNARSVIEGTLFTTATQVPVGFGFPYFGRTRATVDVSVFGHVALGGLLTSTAANESLPHRNPAVGAMDGLYPLWDVLSAQSNRVLPAQVFVGNDGEPGSRRFIVHWAGYRYSTYGTYDTEWTDFSLVLTETGTVEFHYHQLQGNYGHGGSATVGVEALSDELGVEHSFNTTGNISSLSALRLVRVQ